MNATPQRNRTGTQAGEGGLVPLDRVLQTFFHCGMSIDLDSLFANDPLDYWVEIWSDDNKTYDTISKHRRFQRALDAYDKLLSERPDVRIVMRHRAHVYRNHIPARLHNSYDRTKEYPQE